MVYKKKKKKKGGLIRYTTHFYVDHLEQIREIATKRGIDLATVIREVIDKGLPKWSKETDDTPTED